MAKIVNEQYSMENIVRSSSQATQVKIGKVYLHLKYFLFVGNLISALLKVPEFYKMVSFVIGLAQAKQNQGPDEKKGNEQDISLETKLNVVFLYVGLLVVIINQIFVSFKIIRKMYRSLITYLVLFGIYLIFLATAFFANLHGSTMPLAFALFMTKISLFNHLNIPMPSFWWHILFKTSIIIDIFLYIVTIVFYVLITKLKSYTIDRKIMKDNSYTSVENV